MNACVFGGNLTRDPELTELEKQQTCVVNFTIAINQKFQKPDGNWDTKTAFANCVAWDKGARAIYDKFKKGDQIFVEASLESNSWTDSDGNKKSRDRFRVNRFEPPIRARKSQTQNENGSTSNGQMKEVDQNNGVEQEVAIPF